MNIYLISFIIIVIFILFFIINKQNKQIKNLTNINTKLLNQKKSSEVRLGQISEQIAPFLNEYPYDPKNAKFLGQPIDLISFEEDKIVFIEIKTGHSQLSEKQKKLKKLVNDKKVVWEEFRISEKGIKSN